TNDPGGPPVSLGYSGSEHTLGGYVSDATGSLGEEQSGNLLTMLMMLPESIFTLLHIIVIVVAEDLPSQSNMVEPPPTSKGISVAQYLPRRPPKYGEERTPHRLHPVIDIPSVENDFSVWIRLTEFFSEETAWGVEYTLSPPKSTISISKVKKWSARQSHRLMATKQAIRKVVGRITTLFEC
ncbi:MAG: hypothetical protein Q9180_008796, partial [Flavoplaca navasiana]